jgi:hypothetical protein
MIYTVRIDFDDPALRDEVGVWLRDRHIKDVLAAGAQSAKLVSRDDALAIEIRYKFDSREAFAAYERDHAPRLRAEGLAFLAGRPARFTRTTED